MGTSSEIGMDLAQRVEWEAHAKHEQPMRQETRSSLPNYELQVIQVKSKEIKCEV